MSATSTHPPFDEAHVMNLTQGQVLAARALVEMARDDGTQVSASVASVAKAEPQPTDEDPKILLTARVLAARALVEIAADDRTEVSSEIRDLALTPLPG